MSNGSKFKDEILIKNLLDNKEKLRIEFQPKEKQKKAKKTNMPKLTKVALNSNSIPFHSEKKKMTLPKKLKPNQSGESDQTGTFSSDDSEDDNGTIDSEKETVNENDKVDEIAIEEEKKTDEEEEKGEFLCKYNFQINKDPVCKMSFKEDASIEDAKIKIASENGDIDPNCVFILFAGKVLRKDIQIKGLNLISTDILQVFIRSTEDIFLRTARAFRVYG